MRENIGLYRGKRKDNGEWVEGCLNAPKPQFGGEVCIIVQDAPFHSFCYEVDPETVGEYTGLLDEKRKRIFEGDVIAFIESGYLHIKKVGEVVFKRGCYGIEYCPWESHKSFHRIGIVGKWEDMGASGTITYKYYKLGNKWDNPELLQNT